MDADEKNKLIQKVAGENAETLREIAASLAKIAAALETQAPQTPPMKVVTR
jgi:hypothetical protein